MSESAVNKFRNKVIDQLKPIGQTEKQTTFSRRYQKGVRSLEDREDIEQNTEFLGWLVKHKLKLFKWRETAGQLSDLVRVYRYML